MKLTISDSVLSRYPETTIGYAIAEVKVELTHPYVDGLKAELAKDLEKLEINATNFASHPDIVRWQQIYRNDFGVKPSQYRSSIEALVRRVVRGQDIWKVSSIVDLYNCCSLHSLLPMGAYDLKKIQGDIYIRHGKAEEPFLPLGSEEVISVNEKHVVYADDEKVLCWLWNHRDSRLSGIDSSTQHAIFFVDAAFLPHTCSVEKAVESLSQNLVQVGSVLSTSGVLDANSPSVEV